MATSLCGLVSMLATAPAALGTTLLDHEPALDQVSLPPAAALYSLIVPLAVMAKARSTSACGIEPMAASAGFAFGQLAASVTKSAKLTSSLSAAVIRTLLMLPCVTSFPV